ncbi:MAG: DMT family transporter [Thermoplasmata archaeon]
MSQPVTSKSENASGRTAPRSREDLLLLLLVGVLWGSAYPVIREGIVGGAPPLIFAAARYGLTAVLLVPLALLTKARRPARADLIPVAVFGGVFIVGLYGTFLYLGEQSTSGGLAAVLAGSAALWSAIIGYNLLPRERFGRAEVIGLIVGFGGVIALVLPELDLAQRSTFVGSALVLAAVVIFSAGGVFLRRSSVGAPSLWTLALQFSVATAVVGGVAVVLREPLTLGEPSVTLPALAYLIAAPSILGYTIYFRLHHRVGPNRANIVVYVAPVAGVLVGLLAFGEAVTAIEVGGMILIAAGLFLVQRGQLLASKPASNSTGHS